jgi:thymidylate kinase
VPQDFRRAYYRERGIHVGTVEEPARSSPFIEEIVVHGKGTFDLETEVDLFAAQLSAQLRAARQHAMIICDRPSPTCSPMHS